MVARPTTFPPHVLREYALLADGERGALVGPRGEIAWLCVPHWDSDAVLSALIGGPGVYAVTPVDRYVWGGFYEPGSLIWRHRWITNDSVVECRDALSFPGDPDRVVILRRILAVDGEARVRVDLDARAGFGSRPLTDLRRHRRVWTGRTGGLRLRWQGADRIRPTPGRAHRHLSGELTVAAGTHHDLVLELSAAELPDEPVDADDAWEATEDGWRRAVPVLDHCISPPESRHAYAVLRGLTSHSGGMVAAATTSLPERAETGRNYDYRYVWIRDQCFAGHAAAAVGAVGEGQLLADAVRFVTGRLLEHGSDLAPAYTVRGEPVPDQRQLGLPGYPGGFDRVGNWVNRQFQLDAFGEALLLLAEAARHGLVDDDAERAAQVAAEAVERRWQEPDAGIWELEDRRWTHSRLTAAAGLRALAVERPAGVGATRWLTVADRIVAHTAARATHADGHWQRAEDDPALDGALLLPGLRGAVPADDPRTRATLRAYLERLTVDGFAYRFRHDDRPLAAAEGAFTFCGFVTAMALHQQGEAVEARAWWERSRAACGPPMLFSEEFDTVERQLRGNLPQAFVHAVMLESAALLAGSGAGPAP